MIKLIIGHFVILRYNKISLWKMRCYWKKIPQNIWLKYSTPVLFWGKSAKICMSVEAGESRMVFLIRMATFMEPINRFRGIDFANAENRFLGS